jgi:hypothetical protein
MCLGMEMRMRATRVGWEMGVSSIMGIRVDDE